jgi:pre-mRNA-splicing helicase BRR2
VPLEIVIQSFDIANLEARMSAMARPAYTAVCNMLKEATTPADAKSAILFVPTRKQARLTALDLLTAAAADGEPNKFLQVQAHIALL